MERFCDWIIPQTRSGILVELLSLYALHAPKCFFTAPQSVIIMDLFLAFPNVLENIALFNFFPSLRTLIQWTRKIPALELYLFEMPSLLGCSCDLWHLFDIYVRGP